jgi:nitrogen fixation NifU-like protein
MTKKNIYTKEILDIWRNPENFGELDNPTHEFIEANNLCGDEISVQMVVKDGIVKDVKFFGTGCLLCIVSASKLTEKIKGMKVEDVEKMTNEDVLKLLNMKINPKKMYCACLSLKGVQNCLNEGEK